ncbi:MobF family relaxase [Mycetocola sp. 2940]|uniref:MobF family relaxase n=1 Tax=Mycetocola sp. 2940 TaxID=3156452 RepID=UPI003396804A
MKGGVILFRGSGADARRYLESDRSRADEYYLEGGTALAEFSVVDGDGVVIGEGGLTPDEYAQWVDWINPLTTESMGKPRLPGDGRQGSPRFAEMVVNAPKSLSIAAALHPEVSVALDAAQRDAVAAIRAWLGQHSVTRVGPREQQRVVPVEQLETIAVSHKTSRAGDPHRHMHFQIGTRVWAAEAWRGLDTAALFRQQGAIRSLGTAVIAAHPQLAAALDVHGLTLDPVTGEVAELQPFNALMSKRAEQVARNLAHFEKEWRTAHPEQQPGPAAMSRLIAMSWDHERPHKRPTELGNEAAWRTELEDAGYQSDLERAPVRASVLLDEVSVRDVASRALDRCAASASTWTAHDIQEQVTRIITEAGVRADPEPLREVVTLATRLAADDCLSVLPPDRPHPEHVAHLTSLHVIASETRLRDLLMARAAYAGRGRAPNMMHIARRHRLDPAQARAAAAVASSDPLVVVEGAAGAGKTTMLAAAIEAAAAHGRATRVITPTKKAADVAHQELGVATDSVAKLVHEHGWRWNRDGAWTRLSVGETDPETGARYTGPTAAARLVRSDRIVVDEAGMLDQDAALALLTIADEHRATLALVGDRAQLAAIGRGGVLDIAAQLLPRVHAMTTVHRFADPAYAALTVQLRRGEHPTSLFDRIDTLGLVVVHESAGALHDAVAREWREGDAITVATNDEARALNMRIRAERVRAGRVDDCRISTGSDGLNMGCGDVIQTRQNDSALHVANRQTWIVQSVGDDGAVWVKNQNAGRRQSAVRLPTEYVTEHTHLAYASTAHGMQGATVDESGTILGDAMDAAGLYVGMTRGRNSNRLHLVASSFDDAREQFIRAMERDRADRGLTHATAAARESIRGLAPGTDRLQRIAQSPAVMAFERNGSRTNPSRSGLNR